MPRTRHTAMATIAPLRISILSVEAQQARRGTFFRDCKISADRRVADDVRIRAAGRAPGELREVDLRSVPVGVVREDDVGAGLPHDVVEPLRRFDVSLQRIPVRVEARPAPQRREVRLAVLTYRNE